MIQEVGAIDDGMGMIQGLEKRRPWRYSPDTGTVYVGPPGAYHAQMEVPPVRGAGYHDGAFMIDDGSVIPFNLDTPLEVLEEIAGEYGGQVADYIRSFKLGGHRVTNILDPIHETLAPEVWDDCDSPTPTLKPQHQKWIVGEVRRLLEANGYENMEKWMTLVFTGSLTTYQYSERSDVDVSLFVDSEQFPEWSRADLIAIMVGNLDGVKLPGTPYPLQVFVVPPDVAMEDLYKPGLRSGYLIEEGKWIEPPDKTRVMDIEREMHDTYTYALQVADKMDRLLTYEPSKAVMYWHQLHRIRKRDQQAGKGDFAPSNIAYKFLVNNEFVPRIEEVSGESYAM